MRRGILACLLLVLSACSGRSDAPAPAVPAANQAVLQGAVVYRERMALPEGVAVWAQLVEVDAQGRTLQVLAETFAPATAGTGMPYPFALTYAPAAVRPDGHYALAARIFYQGATIFASPDPQPVTLPTTTPVQTLTMRALPDESGKQAPPTPALLTGQRWELRELYGKPGVLYDNQPAPHLVFYPEGAGGRISGSDGCNNLMASYTTNGAKLHFSQQASTMKMCLNGADQSRALAVAISETDNWRAQSTPTGKGQQKNRLELRQRDRVLAVFEAVAL